jgi:hypothetical protein
VTSADLNVAAYLGNMGVATSPHNGAICCTLMIFCCTARLFTDFLGILNLTKNKAGLSLLVSFFSLAVPTTRLFRLVLSTQLSKRNLEIAARPRALIDQGEKP